MELKGCNEWVEMAAEYVDEVARDLGDSYYMNAMRKTDLMGICYRIYHLLKDFDSDTVKMKADKERLKLFLTVVCDDMVLEEGLKSRFTELASCVDSLNFSKGDDGKLLVTFGVEGLWKKKSKALQECEECDGYEECEDE